MAIVLDQDTHNNTTVTSTYNDFQNSIKKIHQEAIPLLKRFENKNKNV